MAEGLSVERRYNKRLTVWLAVAVAFLVSIVNLAFWFNRYIFDQDNFTRIATTAIQQESSRQAVATEITNRLLANRPLLARIAEEPAVKIIAGALGSNVAQKVFDRTINGLQAMATSPNPQDVAVDLTGFKQIAASIVGTFGAQQGEEGVKVEDIPNTITIVSASRVPNIYTLGVVLLWIGPLAALGALALFAYIVYRVRDVWRNIARALLVQSLALILFGALALLVGSLLKPLVIANVQGSTLQTVVANIYGAFVATFNRQSGWVFFGLAALLLLAALAIWMGRPATNWLQQKRHQS